MFFFERTTDILIRYVKLLRMGSRRVVYKSSHVDSTFTVNSLDLFIILITQKKNNNIRLCITTLLNIMLTRQLSKHFVLIYRTQD